MFTKTFAWTLFLIAISPFSLGQASAKPGRPQTATQAAYGKLPLTFEANQGQSDSQVRFLSRAQGYTAFLTADGMVLSVRPKEIAHSDSDQGRGKSEPRQRLEFRFVGSSGKPVAVGEELQPGRVNYFFGNDPSSWHTNVRTYGRVRYPGIYPGIDLIYYGNPRQLEYDFEVHPGADPRRIELEVKGASAIALDDEQNLVLQVGQEKLTFQSPVVYQIVNSQRVNIRGSYVLKGSSRIAFELAQYDSTAPLVIDPVLVYSTYLGGSGTDNARGIAVDAAGNTYIAGFTDSVDFPLTTMGSLATGSPHVFVAKLDATGSNLIYADYLGGNGQEFGYALALDSSNNVYVTGATQSSNFPVVNPYQGTYPGGFNAFLSKISRDGSSLLYSTYLGGNGSDVPVNVALDGSRNIIVSGSTSSTNFPVSNAYQPAATPNQGGVYGTYGFLTKFSPNGSSLVYSTYLGGGSNCGGAPCSSQPTSAINGIAVDATGNAYTAGYTNTNDFPVTSGAYSTNNSTQAGSLVGFVSKFGSSGNLQYSTYFYESSGQLTYFSALAVDPTGSAYAAGLAVSDGTLPLTTNSICDPSTSGVACSYAFVTKFDPTGSNLAYSTFIGPNNFASPTSIVLDANNDAYVLAVTGSPTFVTANAIESYTGGNEMLLVELDPTGTSQLWSTYLGGSLDEYSGGMTTDSNHNIYIAGSTNSSDFPATQGAFRNSSSGNTDAFVVKIGPASSPAVTLSPASLQFGQQAIGSTSSSQNVLVRNMGSAPLSIASITANGDFSETNDCGSSLPGASTCTLSVTFSPVAAGQRSGQILIADDAAGAPHAVGLTGNGSGPVATATPQSLTFAAAAVGSTSTAQPVTLTNNGNMALNMGNIQASGDFSQTNNCPALLLTGSSCTINVSFAPRSSGSRSGQLTVSDDAATSPQSVSLTGTGSDFALSAASSSATVKSGSSATYQLTISPVGGAFGSAVALTCSGLPANATCSFSPASVTPGANAGSSRLTISTAKNAVMSSQLQGSSMSMCYALSLQFPGMALFGAVLTVPSKRTRRLRLLALFGLLACLMLLSACAGGTGIAPGGSGTPAGTYTVTVTGASGTLQHSLPLTLTVQ